MNRQEIRRAAHRGAKFLDKQLPGWSRLVKRRPLDLRYTDRCILGQVGGFETMLYRLALSTDDAYRLGFDYDSFGISDDYEEGEEGDPYAALTEAWREELKVRPR